MEINLEQAITIVDNIVKLAAVPYAEHVRVDAILKEIVKTLTELQNENKTLNSLLERSEKEIVFLKNEIDSLSLKELNENE